MTRKNHLLTWLALPLAFLCATGVSAQITTDLEVGYRFTSISGNEDLYRTQIDEREGFVVRSFSIFTQQNTGVTDYLRIDATDLGTNPSSALRIDTGREDLYRLRFAWRSMDAFSALPAYANPRLAQGVIPGQHTWDRDRSTFDIDLEFFADPRLTPFIGYSQFRNQGPGTTTYTLGGDEFVLGQDLNERESEFRVGTGFRLGSVYGSVTQGWRNMSSNETLTLRGSGNSSNPILGVNPEATAILREGQFDSDTPFTSAWISGDLSKSTRVIANYAGFTTEGEGSDDETAAGTFVSFGIGRFFNGLQDSIDSQSKDKTWRGGVRVESSLGPKFDAMAGYRVEHRELSGTALIDTLFLNSITFGGADARNFREILEAESAVDRDVDVLEAALSARNLGGFAFRVGASVSDYDFTIDPDHEEIVVEGNQGGDFSRKVNTIDGQASFSKGLFSFGASARFDDANRAVLRTDYTNRDRVRVRAGFHTPKNMFRLGLIGENTNAENTLEGGRFSSEGRQWTVESEFAPLPALRLRASWSTLDAEVSARIRRPETFVVETWTNDEDGEVLEGGAVLLLAPFSLDVNLSRYENEGTLPFSVDRWRVRSVYDFRTHYGIAAEYSRDQYEEEPAYGQFDAERYGIFFRYRR